MERITQVVTFKMPTHLIELVDNACRRVGFSNRSTCIRTLLLTFTYTVLRDEDTLRSIVPEAAADIVRDDVANGEVDVQSLALAAALVAAREVADEIIALAEELRDWMNEMNYDTLATTARLQLKSMLASAAHEMYNA